MFMFRRSLVILLGLLVLGMGYAWYEASVQDQAEVLAPGDVNSAPAEVKKDKVAVYVSGAVNKPGIVYVDFESRVGDAVNQCGGVLPTADMNALNMAQTVQDGMHIKVSEKTAIGQAGIGGKAGAENQSAVKNTGSGDVVMVNINQGDAAELSKLKGVGPAMAQRIIDYRNANGAFQVPEDLQKVKGIGPAKFAKLKAQITL